MLSEVIEKFVMRLEKALAKSDSKNIKPKFVFYGPPHAD